MPTRPIVIALLCLILAQTAAPAACVNKFLVTKEDGPRKIVTLLTGKLTYQEARDLAEAIKSGTAPPIEWVNESGKSIAKQYGELKVVRPMPVGCDGKTSGVVVIATFLASQRPNKKMNVKLDPSTLVTFDEQAQ